MPEFIPFPKIPRWFREITITEKIDGTNAVVEVATAEDGSIVVRAGSRNRWITPEKDNYGFADWVFFNAKALAENLGEGTHFGEWWGPGIQRGYGLKEKRFSLFNTHRWSDQVFSGVDGLGVVPILYQGPLAADPIHDAIDLLDDEGSVASPGFMRPEGIVIWHHAGRQLYKATLEGDSEPKSAALKVAA